MANNWAAANRTLVSLLLEFGADPGLNSVSGQTALDYAPTVMRNFIRGYMDGVERDPTTGRPIPKRPAGSH